LLVSLTSATLELGGQAGKDVMIGLGSGTGLWDWGEAPLGHIINDSKLIAGAWINPEDRSFMETPLQASGMGDKGDFTNAPYVNDIAFDDTYIPTTFIPTTFGGYLTMPTRYDNPFKGSRGVFDLTCFKRPNENEYPRTY